jgi:hypothetical protein
VILVIAALAERLAALTFKVKGTIEKDQLTLLNGHAQSKSLPPTGVWCSAPGGSDGPSGGRGWSKKGYLSIKVMQTQVL